MFKRKPRQAVVNCEQCGKPLFYGGGSYASVCQFCDAKQSWAKYPPFQPEVK